MRPPLRPPSAYAAPLDLFLGTPVRIRILRILDEAGDIRRASDIARIAELGVGSVQRALAPLIEGTLVEQIGRGRGAAYRINARHPFAAPVRALFAAERDRRQKTPRAVEAWAASVTPAPIAVWLYGSVARGDDVFGSDVDLAIIAPGPAEFSRHAHDLVAVQARLIADSLADSLRERLVSVSDAALHPSVIVLLPSELLQLERSQPTLYRALLTESEPMLGPAAPALVIQLQRAAARVRHADDTEGTS